MASDTPIYLIDAFTSDPFSGNAAAVVLLEDANVTGWMQAMAMEMNQSETAFVLRRETGYVLRWFTPVVEMDLCGHATLAAVKAMLEHGWLKPGETVEFESRSGVLRCGSDHHGGIRLDFPATAVTAAESAGLADMLGSSLRGLYRCDKHWLAELDSAAAVRRCEPDLAGVATWVPELLIVTAVSDIPDFDIVSRVFAPGVGIDEDPVTGAAHCVLAPFWQEKTGKAQIRAYQASARGGVIHCECQDRRVILSGEAVTVFRGNLHV